MFLILLLWETKTQKRTKCATVLLKCEKLVIHFMRFCCGTVFIISPSSVKTAWKKAWFIDFRPVSLSFSDALLTALFQLAPFHKWWEIHCPTGVCPNGLYTDFNEQDGVDEEQERKRKAAGCRKIVRALSSISIPPFWGLEALACSLSHWSWWKWSRGAEYEEQFGEQKRKTKAASSPRA